MVIAPSPRAIRVIDAAILVEAKAMLAHRGLARRALTRTFRDLHRLAASESRDRLQELRETRREMRP